MAKNIGYLGNPKIKREGIVMDFTCDQIEEIIKCKNDPIYFIENYCKIVSLDKGLILFKMWDFQKELIRTMVENRKVTVLMPRQTSKSSTTAAYITWHILFKSHQTFAIIAHKLAGAKEVLNRIKIMYENLPLFLQCGVLEWNKTSILLENGSKIHAAATGPNALTGLSLSGLLWDEAALANNQLSEDMMASAWPTLSSGTETKMFLCSTPRGRGNIFYRVWKEAEMGVNGFIPFSVKWDAVPHRTLKWLEEQRVALGELKFQQEVMCSFENSGNTLISGHSLSSLATKTPIREDEKLKIFEEPVENHNYISIADVARGTENDYSTLITIDVSVRPFRVVCTFRCNEISTEIFPDKIKGIAGYYNDAFVVVETNDMGESVVNTLFNELEYENVFKTSASTIEGWNKPDHLGLRTTVKTKRKGCEALKSLIESNQLDVNDINIISELSTFVAKRNSYSAESGSHDDLVMPLVLFGWLTRQLYFKDLIGIDRTNLLSSGISRVTEELLIMGVTKEEAGQPLTKQELDMVDPEFQWMFDSNHQLDYMNSFLNQLNGKEDDLPYTR